MSPPLAGNAAFVWTDPDAGPAEQVFLLRVPLQNVRHSPRTRRWVNEGLDYTVRDVRSYGDVDEIVATVRYADDSVGLANMLRAGARGLTLNYVPDLAVPEQFHPCYLIEPDVAAVPTRDVDGPGFVEWTLDVRLRRTDGADFV